MDYCSRSIWLFGNFAGFFIAFLVVNHNIRLEQRRKVKETGLMDDLNKNIYGEDCQ